MNTIFIVLPILVLLMFDLGLTLRPADFRLVVERPRAILVGLAGQILLLPLIGLAIGYGFQLEAVFFLGVMLAAVELSVIPPSLFRNAIEPSV